jgi:predicted 3-demethylubiquinone-9 3-methyltransferase (glyoxalase superfamily)
MQKITPLLWFNDNAEAAVNFYLSVFKDGRILEKVRYGEAGPGPAGSIMTIKFQIHGQEFVALNGGPPFKFTEATAFIVNCETQKEVDYFWEKLSEGGEKSRCGWLYDKFGLPWNIVPTLLPQMLGDKDTTRANRVMKVMMEMDKLEIEPMQRAFEGD